MRETDDAYASLSSYLTAYQSATRQDVNNNNNNNNSSSAVVADVSPRVSMTPSPQRVLREQGQDVLRPLEQLLEKATDSTITTTTTTTASAVAQHTKDNAKLATTTSSAAKPLVTTGTTNIALSVLSAANSPATVSSTSASVPAPPLPQGGTTSLEFQRQLALQQQAQAERERAQLREELHTTQAQLTALTRQYNAQQAEQNSLAHRYSVTMSKLTNAEAEVRKVEAELVAERSRGLALRETLDHVEADLKDARRASETWQHKYELELEQHNQLRESQRTMLLDRRQYLPTAEVQRTQTAQLQAQQALLQRILNTLNALRTNDETAETGFFVARSAVLSAATDLSSRVARAEAALTMLHEQMEQYKALESETNEFVLGIMSENKAIWEQWNALREAQQVRSRQGRDGATRHQTLSGGVAGNASGMNGDYAATNGAPDPHNTTSTSSQHRYLTLQLEGMTERLQKAQQLVEVQTALVRAHEQQMTALQETNAELQATVDALRSRHAAEMQEQASAQAAALESTQNALQEARNEVAALQQTLVTERGRVDETVRRLRDNQAKVQEEYEEKLGAVQRERAGAVQAAEALTAQLEQMTEQLQSAQAEHEAQLRHWTQYTAHVEQVMSEHVQCQLDQVQALRVLLEQELAQVREEVGQSTRRAREATREKLAAETASDALRVQQRVMQSDLAQTQQELASVQEQLGETSAQLRSCVTELHELRQRSGEEGGKVRELEAALARAEEANKTLTEYVEEENARHEQRLARAQEAGAAAESARAALQQEAEKLRAQVLTLRSLQHNEAQLAQDKEQLMQENLRLHEAYERITSENVQLGEQLEQLRGRQQNAQRLSDELHALQDQLRALPELRQAAEAAVAAAQTAEEETNALRRERDAIARRLEAVLTGNAQASKFEEQFSRVLEDAQDAVKRLGGQLRNVTTASNTKGEASQPLLPQTLQAGNARMNAAPVGPMSQASVISSARRAATHSHNTSKNEDDYDGGSYHVFSNTRPTSSSQAGPSHLNARLASSKASAETTSMSLLDTSYPPAMRYNAASQNASAVRSASRKTPQTSQEPIVSSEPLMRSAGGDTAALFTPQRPWKS